MPLICDENGENCEYYPDEPSGSAPMFWEQDPIDLENLPELLPQASYSNEGRNYPTPESTQGPGGSPVNASTAWQNQPWAKNLPDWAKSALGFASSKAGFAGLAALAGLLDRARPSGGGAKEGMMAPRQYARSVVSGPYGPLVQYAANGGLMQAYASGGAVRPFPMQDGGFVMTADAVKGAEKLADGGITSLLPDAKMIRGPGTGTSDDIPAYIQGPNGRTPAKLSNGEAYVPPGRDTKGLYALMHKLERKA
jgi:hypothetical protein